MNKEEMIENIYKEYPRKINKKKAIIAIGKAWNRLKEENNEDKEIADMLLDKTKKFAKSNCGNKDKIEKGFIPHPATWFNQDRFLNDYDEVLINDLPIEDWDIDDIIVPVEDWDLEE